MMNNFTAVPLASSRTAQEYMHEEAQRRVASSRMKKCLRAAERTRVWSWSSVLGPPQNGGYTHGDNKQDTVDDGPPGVVKATLHEALADPGH